MGPGADPQHLPGYWLFAGAAQGALLNGTNSAADLCRNEYLPGGIALWDKIAGATLYSTHSIPVLCAPRCL